MMGSLKVSILEVNKYYLELKYNELLLIFLSAKFVI